MAGYQGYVTSRPFMGVRTPQHIQNIIIREYCSRMGFNYLLSGTEYAIPGSFLVLQSLIDNISNLDGLVAYSLFQMPLSSDIRRSLFLEIIEQRKEIHFAVEGISLSRESDIMKVEDIWRISEIVETQPNVQDLI